MYRYHFYRILRIIVGGIFHYLYRWRIRIFRGIRRSPFIRIMIGFGLGVRFLRHLFIGLVLLLLLPVTRGILGHSCRSRIHRSILLVLGHHLPWYFLWRILRGRRVEGLMVFLGLVEARLQSFFVLMILTYFFKI